MYKSSTHRVMFTCTNLLHTITKRTEKWYIDLYALTNSLMICADIYLQVFRVRNLNICVFVTTNCVKPPCSVHDKPRTDVSLEHEFVIYLLFQWPQLSVTNCFSAMERFNIPMSDSSRYIYLALCRRVSVMTKHISFYWFKFPLPITTRLKH